MFRGLLIAASAALVCTAAPAQDKRITLTAPPALADSGLLDYILPRFSLKTGIRIARGDPPADVTLAPDPPGRAVFRRGETTWHVTATPDDPEATRFADWLASDIGRTTVDSFATPDGTPFTADLARAAPDAAPLPQGNAERGATLAHLHCGRCHVTDPAKAFGGVGSTPSFAVLRGLPDWQDRFTAFYALNPHGAFTQIAEVTEPFPDNRPSPIVPIELELDDIDAILAFVAGLAPADLGAPIEAN